MRLPVRFSFAVAALAALVLCAGTRAGAQAAPAGQPSSGQSPSGQSSSSSPAVRAQTTEPPPAPVYISVDPLANVRYNNRYDISVGMAYRHIKAGPNLLQGANLGGIDLEGSYWLTKRWGIEGTGRGYLGTSGAAPNPYAINGPFIMDYIFAGGPEWLGPHNKHGALTAHVLGGGAWGIFEQNLRGHSTESVGFYHDQIAPAVVMGGHLDLNRSPRWVFRTTVDGLLTAYAINWGDKSRHIDINTTVSVGVLYRFKSTR